jgi:exonuclease I
MNKLISRHCKILLNAPDFAEKIRSVFEDRPEFTKQSEAEAQLYDGFIGDRDRIRAASIVNANDLADMQPDFDDERLTRATASLQGTKLSSESH